MKKTMYILLATLLMTVSSFGEITFRGAWIATVANIDWPTPKTIGNTAEQQIELVGLIDSLESLGMNAIIFQIRPTADALYESEIEPVSSWLTGKQGSWGEQEPWDPLDFFLTEAHARGMEVHVWLNPYRINLATQSIAGLVNNHVMRQHPEWFWRYGQQWYFDPGLDATREWICDVVRDIVSRYDVDAIHMDDYFYPYPISGSALPDQKTFAEHPRGFDNIHDWRRNNVNLVIEQISQTIRTCNPDVRFGISPFGVWRNYNPTATPTQELPAGSHTQALTNYDDLYADILLWIRRGWIDYVLPQLYWEIGNKRADYDELAHWWAEAVQVANEQSPRTDHPCQLYVGMAPYRLGGENENSAWRNGNEIARQMRLNRTIPTITGECFYSTRPLLKNPRHVCDSIMSFEAPLPFYKDETDTEEPVSHVVPTDKKHGRHLSVPVEALPPARVEMQTASIPAIVRKAEHE